MEKPKDNESKGKEVEEININDNEVEFDIFRVRNPLINSMSNIYILLNVDVLELEESLNKNTQGKRSYLWVDMDFAYSFEVDSQIR